ncbi:MAG: chloride channel protein [Rhodospirillum sp.]|nr:chloride channel protein [Rhodospirillum sp.]MCF8488475.1 chloride channel protein [Rhodospirillum sp.]MCF8502379.1 chloride channel protein [Rhodospirillum sp.]
MTDPARVGSAGPAPSLLVRFRSLLREDQLVLGGLAVLLGAVVGLGVCLFRELIGLIQAGVFGGDHDYLASLAREASSWVVVLGPTLGGLAVGLLYRYVMPGNVMPGNGPGREPASRPGREPASRPGREPLGVANVIEDMALAGARMDGRKGLVAALGSALSIGVGGSVGREGPAVHLGATFCALVARRLRLGERMARTLLGCGAAAAVAASFNTPIAGALFANEVIIGHYALSAFAPVVLASVAGTVVSRVWFGHESVFSLPGMTLTSFWEFPAFAGLGLVAGLLALAFMRGIFLAQTAAIRSRLPQPIRPMVAGFAVGLTALWLPEVLGIGYETTDQALKAAYGFQFLVTVILAKMVATMLCLGWGFGGGVFSPSLTLGALLGSAYGIVATSVFPALSSGETAYALIGMGAMSAAVLGAPISTTLIIFEFTGDYELTIGVVVATVIASGLVQGVSGHDSFFHWQLARKGIRLGRGKDGGGSSDGIPLGDLPRLPCPSVLEEAPREAVALALRVSPVSRVFTLDGEGRLTGVITVKTFQGRWDESRGEDGAAAKDEDGTVAKEIASPVPLVVTPRDSLSQALAALEEDEGDCLVLVEDRASRRVMGILREADVLRAHNRALIANLSIGSEGPNR